jgi:hypothetical protein
MRGRRRRDRHVGRVVVSRVRPIRAGVWSDHLQADPMRALDRRLEALSAAEHTGHERGYQRGYLAGWRWGVICGGVAGLVLGALLVILPIAAGVPVGGW